MLYRSNNNVVLIDGCRPLRNLSVLLEVIDDISTVDGNGFSLQLNCYPPPGHYVQYQQLNGLQYVVVVQHNHLYWGVQYWAEGASSFPPAYTPMPGTTPWLPCWAEDYYYFCFGEAPGNKLRRRSSMRLSLGTDPNANVSLAEFLYTDPDGNRSPAQFSIPPNALCPIVAFTVNLVGPLNWSKCTFTTEPTTSRGVLHYSVGSGTLSIPDGGLFSSCHVRRLPTAETSNAVYSAVCGAPGSTVTQSLRATVPCALEILFAEDAPAVQQMRNIRDEHLDAPAGAFLSEALARHSPDLIDLLAKHPELRSECRHLLLEAVRVAEDGGRFEDQLVERAEGLVRQAEAFTPSPMSGIPDAIRTVLASLRGRTLADGLAKASEVLMRNEQRIREYLSPPPTSRTDSSQPQ